MRKLLNLFFILFIYSAYCVSINENTGIITINNIQFKPNPVFCSFDYGDVIETFDVKISNINNEICMEYYNSNINITINLNESPSFNHAYKFNINTKYKKNFKMKYFYIDFNQLDYDTKIFTGLKAIKTKDLNNNVVLNPYMDKFLNYNNLNDNFWIVASNYEGAKNIESINNNRFILYDYRFHFHEKLNNQLVYEKSFGFYPKENGLEDNFSFLIFTNEPLFINKNLWPSDKKAAFCITNDADCESLDKVKAIFWGSNNPDHEKYMTSGLITNNIPISHTIFGENFYQMKDFLNEIKKYNNKIGYHTYSFYADSSYKIRKSLIDDLEYENIRLWIDHDASTNNEDFLRDGTKPESPFFVADIVNESNIKYIWHAESPAINIINSFENAHFLPHLVYDYPIFTRPIWFMGRTRAEFWEYNYINSPFDYENRDFKKIVTSNNLENLLNDNGLCIIYTHFSPTDNYTFNGFLNIEENNTYYVKDEVNSCFQMLDYFQNLKGLWIAPLEEIFDRLISSEDVKVFNYYNSPINTVVTFKNFGPNTLKDVNYVLNGEKLILGDFLPFETKCLTIRRIQDSLNQKEGIFSYFSGNYLNIKNYNKQILNCNQLSIYNIKGQFLTRRKISNIDKEITQDFSKLPSGIYLVKLTDINNQNSILKVNYVK